MFMFIFISMCHGNQQTSLINRVTCRLSMRYFDNDCNAFEIKYSSKLQWCNLHWDKKKCLLLQTIHNTRHNSNDEWNRLNIEKRINKTQYKTQKTVPSTIVSGRIFNGFRSYCPFTWIIKVKFRFPCTHTFLQSLSIVCIYFTSVQNVSLFSF